MHARVDRRGVVTFPALFPRVTRDHTLTGALKKIVAGRTARALPAHKRLDARRASISASIRQGDLWLAVEIRGANHDYAVSGALNLINELFVFLHERYPEYLAEHFGISTE
jgi:hypothetical protein